MLLALILKADAGCFGIIPFLFIFFIVISIISKANKMQNQSGGSFQDLGGHGQLGDLLKSLPTQNTLGSTGLSGGYKPPKRKGPPINWNRIKMNMSKEQIQECFDMTALSRGVKKKDLPKFVNLNKLKGYFTEPQLRDMIDLDFFMSAQKVIAEAPRRGKLKSTLTTISATKSKKLTRSKSTMKSSLTHSDSTTRAPSQIPFEKVSSESFTETVAHDDNIVEERLISESTLEDQVREEMAVEKVLSEFSTFAAQDSSFRDIQKKLGRGEKKALAKMMQKIAAKSAPKFEGGSPVDGIVWMEILKRPQRGKRGSSMFGRRAS